MTKFFLFALAAAAAVPVLAQQTFDFKTLDKLAANAKESTNISLDPSSLKMATGLIGDDNAEAKSILANLKSMQIRTFEFDSAGQYSDADLEPLRTYLSGPRWSKLLDVREKKESTQIYTAAGGNGQPGGWALISAEPKELAIIFVEGDLSLADLTKLKGMGIPNMKLDHGGKDKIDDRLISPPGQSKK